jgi:uncharacterized membrane protein
MYVCDRCGGTIAANKTDPVVVTQLGKMHYRCMQQAWHEKEHARELAQQARRAREAAASTLTTLIPSSETS